jgi:Ser/Thr protein kinase RdoA (MazF antagonist)
MTTGSVSGLDFFQEGSLPAPRVSEAEAEAIAQTHFGLTLSASPLGSQQDQNFLLRNADTPVGVLKFANQAIGLAEISAQDKAADRIAEACPDVRVATTTRNQDGEKLLRTVETSSGPLVTWVVSYLPGGTLVDRGYLSPSVVGRLGALAGQVSRALEGFEDPGLDRVLQWDLRHGKRAVDALARHIPDAGSREDL